MILDEVTCLVATKASVQDYVSRVSFFGAIVFISLAVLLLWLFIALAAIEHAFGAPLPQPRVRRLLRSRSGLLCYHPHSAHWLGPALPFWRTS